MIFKTAGSELSALKAFGEQPATMVVICGKQAYFRRTIEKNKVATRPGWEYDTPLIRGNLTFYNLRWSGSGSIIKELERI